MDDRFNTIAGWTLFGGIVALGLSSVSGQFFKADKTHRPETMGYAIEGVEVEGEAGEAAVPLPVLLAAADPAAGEKVYAKCKTCHTINQGGANGIGPNLYGIMGKPVGKHAAGFAYSSDLAGHGGAWDFANMDAWLASPKKFASGTKMSFAGLGKPEDRANIIVYLNAQGSNLPLPAPPAAGAEEAAAAEGAAAGDPSAGAGPAEKTSPAAAGAVAQPAPQADGGGDKAAGAISKQ
jgi:cytochrome c